MDRATLQAAIRRERHGLECDRALVQRDARVRIQSHLLSTREAPSGHEAELEALIRAARDLHRIRGAPGDGPERVAVGRQQTKPIAMNGRRFGRAVADADLDRLFDEVPAVLVW